MKYIVIGAVIVILAIGLLWFSWWYTKHRARQMDKAAGRAVNGDLNTKQEQQLILQNSQAAQLFHELLRPPSSVDSFVMLPEGMQSRIEHWLKTHESRKVLPR